MSIVSKTFVEESDRYFCSVVQENREGNFSVGMSDKVLQIALGSMISEFSEALYNRHYCSAHRKAEKEHSALLDIYASNMADTRNFSEELRLKVKKLTITPFGSYVVFDFKGTVLGELCMNQGYTKEGIACEQEDVYVPSDNETKIEMVLKPDLYEKYYVGLIALAVRVTEYFSQKIHLQKPVNSGLEEFFSRPRQKVDRVIFTIKDWTKLEEDVSPEFKRQQELVEENLVRTEVVTKMGYLTDPHTKELCIVYGRNIA